MTVSSFSLFIFLIKQSGVECFLLVKWLQYAEFELQYHASKVPSNFDFINCLNEINYPKKVITLILTNVMTLVIICK